MPSTITVDARVIGRRAPVFTDLRIEIPGAESGRDLTLRELIERIVREEVRAFKERQERRLLPSVLSRAEIEQAALAGKVDMGGRETEDDAEPEAAVATALQGFEDGLYYVFVDDHQKQQLDEAVPLRTHTHVTFLRLIALAGG